MYHFANHSPCWPIALKEWTVGHWVLEGYWGAHAHTIRAKRKPPLAKSILMYIGCLSEYIALRLSKRSLTIVSEEMIMRVLVPRIREYIGLSSRQQRISLWLKCGFCGFLTRIPEPISEIGDGRLVWASIDVGHLSSEEGEFFTR